MRSLSCLTCLLAAATQSVHATPIASPVVERQAPPATFTPNATPGGGGSTFKDSAHFRVYNPKDDSAATAALQTLEAAHTCMVGTLGWRTTGLSYNSDNDNGPFYKTNLYDVSSIGGGAAGVMGSEPTTGLSFLQVVTQYLRSPDVFVHEYGHGLTYAERYWVDQGRTGAWWETTAQFVADTYLTSPQCADARKQFNQADGASIIDVNKVIGSSFQVLVDGTANSGNYYEAWPFLSYLFYNPDNYAGLGKTVFPDLFRKYSRGSNETPLHTLQRLATATKVQAIVGRYWARMAYVDIGNAKAQAAFERSKGSINYANTDSQGGGKYRVKSARQPRYFGASIVPLKGTGEISAAVTAGKPFTATLVVKPASGAVRYTDLVNGSGKVTVASGEQASLVVANTPAALLLYDPFSLSSEASAGLDWSVTLTGATV